MTWAAVVAAAGQSRRMGVPKQLLPWGGATVIEAVVMGLAAAGLMPIACVVGHRAEEMRAALRTMPAHLVYNAAYDQREMLASYQAGIDWLLAHPVAAAGTFLALCDQPHLPAAVLASLLTQARRTPSAIVIPSYRRRRGHPIVLPRRLWPALLALDEADTLRTLIDRHIADIVYVDVESEAILCDIDTLADYRRLRPPAPDASATA